MKVVQFSPSGSPELHVRSNFLLGRIVRSQTVFSIRMKASNHFPSKNVRRLIAAGVFEDMIHDLRALLRLAKGKKEEPSAVIFDGRTMQSTPESGDRAGYDGYKRKKGSKIHMAVDTLGLLLA